LCFESDLLLLFICRPEAFMTPFACSSLKTMRRFLLKSPAGRDSKEEKRQKESYSKSPPEADAPLAQ
jgi:hypothetical protein